MKIWLACFGVLFAIAELYQWLKHLTLPLPMYILGGALLAIASNHNKLASSPWRDSDAEPPPVMPSAHSPNLSPSTPVAQPPQPIPLTIRRPTEQSQEAQTRSTDNEIINS
jgi:hypothetical protein